MKLEIFRAQDSCWIIQQRNSVTSKSYFGGDSLEVGGENGHISFFYRNASRSPLKRKVKFQTRKGLFIHSMICMPGERILLKGEQQESQAWEPQQVLCMYPLQERKPTDHKDIKSLNVFLGEKWDNFQASRVGILVYLEH